VTARLPSLPRFRQRLSEPRTGGLSWPDWVGDERFEVAHHVHQAGLPAPGDERALLAWAGDYYSQRLDRARPLWELVVIELADGRWALVTKTHHCLVDGVGSVDMAYALLDIDPDAGPEPDPIAAEDIRPPPPPERAGPPGGPGRVEAAARRGAGAIRDTARRLAGEAASVAAHPRESLRHSRAMAEMIVRDELIAAPRTSLNDPIGAHRRLSVLTAPLAELKAIRSSLGGTVNDVILAAAAGGFRRLLIGRDEEPPAAGLRAMVPVNVRSAGEHLEMGNRITSLFVHLPVSEADPRRRYERQVEEAEGLKSGTQAEGSLGVVDLAGHAPPMIHAFLARSLFATRLFNVTITNVPGPEIPLYCLGSRMRGVWPLVPIAAEHAVGIAVVSYDGTLFFCVNADRDTMPDLKVLSDGIRDSIEELGALAAQPAPG
jgi:WS/DGAT/MGAT family acyltransferase